MGILENLDLWPVEAVGVSRRNFPTVSQATLEKWLSWVLLEIATGKVTNTWTTPDAGAGKWIDHSLPPERRRDLILNDLGILDPATYPPAGRQRLARTVPRYTG